MNLPEKIAHILLVEDDARLGASTCDMLRLTGHSVSWVSSAAAAYELLIKPPPFTAVLLDLGLSDEDGVSLMRRLLQRQIPLPPIIIYSGQSIEALKSAAMATKAKGILHKPCSAQEMVSALRSAISQ
jgi:DNA-binding response OmpR family regulator